MDDATEPREPAPPFRAWRPVLLGALFIALFYPRILHLVTYTWQEDKYSHGYFIPLVSLYWLYVNRDWIRSLPRRPANGGLVLILVGLFAWIFAQGRNFNAVAHLSMLLVLTGMVVFSGGWRFLYRLSFPVYYLVFAFPVPKRLDETLIGPKLQRLASVISEKLIDLTGIPVHREGNVIEVPGIRLLVEEACSGIHSLYTLAALGTAFVFLTDRRPLERAILIAATLPIAIAANVFRVTVTGILAHEVSLELAQGFFHEAGGLVVFLFGLGILLLLATILRRFFFRPVAREETA
jgi:exosortase